MGNDRMLTVALSAGTVGLLAQAITYIEAHGIRTLTQAILGH